jgi:xylulokinase
MYSLGIDLGSSSVKLALFDTSYRNKAVAIRYPESDMMIDSPKSGWAEQDPDLWWNHVLYGIQKLTQKAGIASLDISSIGIAYQMHGLVLLNKSGEVLRPSIIWCDSRAVLEGHDMTLKLHSEIVEHHLLNHPGNFTAAKLSWVKKNEPHLFEQIHKVMLPGDFIAYKMSQHFSSSYSGMSEGIFWDFKINELSAEILDLLDISSDKFPELGGSFDILARTDEAFEQLSGIKKGTPISYRAGDQPNNAFALGVLKPGEAAGTGGTSGVIYAVSDKVNFDPHSRVNTFAHVNHNLSNPAYGTLLCINGTGIMYQWIRNNFFPGLSYEECENIAAEVSSDGVFSLPFGNGVERILKNVSPDACFQGIDFNRHDKRHLLRAGLEGIAFSFVYGLDILRSLGIQIDKMRVGADNLFQSKIFSQIIADLGNIQIDMYDTTGAVGAAKGSAYGAGLITSLDETWSDLKASYSYISNTQSDNTKESYNRWLELLNNSIKK